MPRRLNFPLSIFAMIAIAVCFSGCGEKEAEPPVATGTETAPVETAPAETAANAPVETPAAAPPGDAADEVEAAAAGAFKDAISTVAAPTDVVAANGIDMSYLTAKQYFAIIAHPQRLLASDLVRSLKEDENGEVLLAQAPPIPESLQDASRVLMLFGNPADQSPPEDLTIVISFDAPVDQDEIGFALTNSTADDKKDGKYVGGGGQIVFFHDAQTAVMVDESRGEVQAAQTPVVSELAAALNALTAADLDKDVVVLASIDAARPMIEEQLKAGQLPPPVAGFASSINDMSVARIALDVSGESLLDFQFRGVNDQGAQNLELMLGGILQMGKGVLASQQGDIPAEQQAGFQLANNTLQSAKVVRDGIDVSLTLKRPDGLDEFLQTIPQMLLGARRTAAGMRGINDMKQIALSMHNYHSVHGRMPGIASRNKEGKAVLSWQVALLPYLEEATLYEEFDQEKPWDSEPNQQLSLDMPLVYGDIQMSSPDKSNKAIFYGEGTPFDVKGQGPKFSAIRDGTSNTIMFIEVPAANAEIWTKPHVIRFDPQDPLGKLGEFPNGKVVVAFFDGSVHTLPADLPAETWRKLIQHQDGEIIDRSEWDN